MPISKKRLEEINAIKDKDIDTEDIPELDERFWKNARLVLPKPKPSISLRIDSDVLEWFKSIGRGYQTRMNAVLRAYMEAHREKHS
ncbi:MAG: BrnA antitoxin family protein [Candidatus Omnitrophota bacterium]